jgi:uncharacterized protein YndB with AHSA1/START domain
MTQSVATRVSSHSYDKSASDNPRGILHSLSSAIHLHGDTHRIFHAITIPEFLEAWICIPCNEQDCRSRVELSGESLAVRHICPSGRNVSIFGDFIVRRRRRLLISWRTDSFGSSPRSRVTIRLYGAFEKTLLSLHHTGFHSEDEKAWHHALWTLSLEKLTRLLC